MNQKRLTGYRLAGVGTALLMLVFALTPASLKAQDQNQPAATANSQDSKTDSNVMTALGSSKELENVAITTNTQGGVVTLTGVVRNQHQKQLAESLTAHASGVNRVVNNLTIDAAPPQDAAAPAVPANTTSENGTPNTAVLMSDGSMSDGSTPGADGSGPADQNGAPQQDADNGGQPSVAGQPGDQQNGYPQNGPPQGPNGGYGVPNGGRSPYGQNAPPRRPPQVGGQQVVVQPGAMLRIRTMQTLDSRNLKAGTPFNAVVLNDVMAGGAIAIPRGASLQGTVIESKKAGAFGGRGKLIITLNSVSMGGQGYQIASDAWSNEGPSKTGRTVGNAIGLGAVGALIGAAAGGGPGAAIGAAAGGATGVAASGASPTMQAFIPAEAVLIFHLQRPLTVTTVGQEELNRLAQNVPPMQRRPQMRRGYYGGYPPPPPAYYGQYPY